MKNILITSSILILALILLRHLLRGRISLRLQYALWLLAAVRLLVPLELGQSGFSVLSLAGRAEETPAIQAVRQVGNTVLPAPSPSYDNAYAQVAETYASRGVDMESLSDDARAAMNQEALRLSQGVTLGETALSAAPVLWAAGTGLMAAWFLAVNLRFRRKVRRSAQAVELSACPLPVVVSEAIPSPCLLGLFRPVVCLTPACLADEDRLRHVLAHELTHYRHRDPWWSLVRGVCLCVYWFDPLVWWAASLSRRDCELACDEGAIRRLGEPERLAYGRTLVDLVAVGGSPAGLLQTATTMADRRKGIRERIALITKRPRMMAATLFLVLAAAAALVVCTFTGAQRPSLTEQLQDLPPEFADVVYKTDYLDEQSGKGWSLPEGTVVSAYYLPTYLLSSYFGPDHTIGWIGDLYHIPPDRLDSFSPPGAEDGVWECVGKDSVGYYALLYPLGLDSGLKQDFQQDYFDKRPIQEAFLAWVRQVVLAQPGMEPATPEEALALPGTANEQAAALLEGLLKSGDSVTVTEDLASHGGRTSVFPASDDQRIRDLFDGLTARFRWTDTGSDNPLWTDPWGDENLDYFFCIHDPGDSISLTFYAGSAYVEYRAAGGLSTNFCVTPLSGDDGPAAYIHDWFSGYYPRTDIDAEDRAQSLLYAIAGGPVSMTLTRIDGVGGGRYEADPAAGNGPYCIRNFTSRELFRWNHADAPGLPASPEPEASLLVESADGSQSLQFWSSSDKVKCTDGGETFWLEAVPVEASVFSSDIFQHMRFWYDEAEINGLRGDVVIPEQGQGRQEIAQAWVDATQSVMLRVTPGSKYACTYVRNVVEIWEDADAPDSWYADYMLKTEHFCFSYRQIFVPENETALSWMMAGNTGDYDGQYGDAPEGALIRYQMGPMYLAEDGWRCDGTGTGP